MTGRRRAVRAVRLAAAAAALCGLLAGCVSIPGHGPVQVADKVANDSQRARGYGSDPSPTAGPVRTVEMFIGSSLDYANDHAISRKYLLPSPGPRLKWRPESPVTVFSGTPEVTFVGGRPSATPSAVPSGRTAAVTPAPSPPAPSPAAPSPAASSPAGSPSAGSAGTAASTPATPAQPTPPPRIGETATVLATVTVYAVIDASGQYTRASGARRESRIFELSYTQEGWRIASLENGILLNQAWFGQIYQSLPVYFPDKQNTYLVPDVRWFPSKQPSAASTPSAVVSAVLGGPAAWLKPAVENVVPDGTHQTVAGVKIVDGVATVDLSREVRDADARQRRLLKRQFDATLTGDENVVSASRVMVTVEQQVLEMQPSPGAGNDVPGANPDSAGLRLPPDDAAPPVALDSKGALVQLEGRQPRPIAGLGALAFPSNKYPAAEPGGLAYAVLTADRTKLLYAQPSRAPLALVLGHALSPPSFDPFGWVWTAQDQAGGVVYAGRPDPDEKPAPQVVRLPVDWLGASRVRSLRISREGARAVLVVAPPEGPPQVVVCAILRDAEGRPTAFGPPQRLLPEAVDVTATSWMDPSHVVVLAREAGQADPMPWIVEIGGDVERTIPAPGAVSVTVDPQQQLWITLADGAVQHRSISSWEPVPGVRFAAVPG